MRWIHDDGGRRAAGFRGGAGDCVVRSVAIATGLDYRFVYDTLNELARAHERPSTRQRPSSARNGVRTRTIHRFMAAHAPEWQWTATMRIGSGCRVHLRADELPPGRLIVKVTKHVTCVIDGVVFDTHDPCRAGTRCVYGYWRPPVSGDPEVSGTTPR